MNSNPVVPAKARIQTVSVVPRLVRGIQTINWPSPKNVNAYFTTRIGGASTSAYDSFNLAAHVEDNPDYVKKNREILRNSLNLPNEPAWLNQTHSNIMKELTEPTPSPIDADATFTTKPGLVCSVFSADCVPILVTNKSGTLVAAIHAGWKGLQNGVITNTIAALPDDTKNLLAYIGPAICQRCYEVGADVKTQFDSAFNNAFIPSHRDQYYLLDTKKIAELQLRQLGINDITIDSDCTSCLKEKYYSFRRDGQTGRMAALIWLDAE